MVWRLNAIPEKHRMYLCYRLGFCEDEVPRSTEDIAKHVGLTLGYARTFEEEAVVMCCWNCLGGMRKQADFLSGLFQSRHKEREIYCCGDTHAENTRILQKLFNFQHPVTDADMGLDVLGIRILFDFLSESCHVYPQGCHVALPRASPYFVG